MYIKFDSKIIEDYDCEIQIDSIENVFHNSCFSLILKTHIFNAYCNFSRICK